MAGRRSLSLFVAVALVAPFIVMFVKQGDLSDPAHWLVTICGWMLVYGFMLMLVVEKDRRK